jgi:hypothetical protein
MMHCPNCKNEMETLPIEIRAGLVALDPQQGRTLDIQHCAPCESFWFDDHDSLKLSEQASRGLMDLIHKKSSGAKAPGFADDLRCPYCPAPLQLTHDLQGNTHFSYWRCGDHGRLIRYFEFLKEKSFIRELTLQEIHDLQRKVGMIHCANCAAPIDLGKGTVCAYCGTPVSMLESGLNVKERGQ